MFSIFDAVVLIVFKLVMWSFILSLGIVWLRPNLYDLILTKMIETIDFYINYLGDKLTDSQRKAILNVWSPSKFADSYWFVYTKSTSK